MCWLRLAPIAVSYWQSETNNTKYDTKSELNKLCGIKNYQSLIFDSSIKEVAQVRPNCLTKLVAGANNAVILPTELMIIDSRLTRTKRCDEKINKAEIRKQKRKVFVQCFVFIVVNIKYLFICVIYIGGKAISEDGPASRVLLRKEVLRLIINLSSSVGTKGHETGLLT